MANISKINTLLEGVKEFSPSGFAIAFHIRLTSADFVFQTYPKNWTDLYSEKGYVMVDPTVRWGFTEIGSIRWSDLVESDEHGILEQCAAHGMTYGVTIAVEMGNSRSMASFSRTDREFSDEEIATLHDHVKALHELTASKTGMSQALRDELHALSVEMTHPAAS